MDFVMLGAVVIGGYFLLKNPNILGGLGGGGGLGSGGTLDPIPPVTPPPTTTPPPSGGSGSGYTPSLPGQPLNAQEKAILLQRWGVTLDKCTGHPIAEAKASRGKCVSGAGLNAVTVTYASDGATCLLSCDSFNNPAKYSVAEKRKMGVANCKCNAGGNRQIAQTLLGASSSYARVYVTYAHGFPRYTPNRIG